MHLHRIILTNYKNYNISEVHFSDKLNCFVGKNGMGKTNLLDAIYYICMSKSYFALPDRNIVRVGATAADFFFRIEAIFERQNRREKVVVKVVPSKTKTIDVEDVPHERLADHVGLYPVVFISPDDTLLVREGSEERRRFIDSTLAQLDATYLHALMEYNRVLKQRNALLKQPFPPDAKLLDVYDQRLAPLGELIYEKRCHFFKQFEPIFEQFYDAIAEGGEQTSCHYRSTLAGASFANLLQMSREKDILAQRTTQGIHRDDVDFFMKNGAMSVKRFASQGQLKSYIVSLKLAQYEFLRQQKNIKPLLLLDDVFDKLDDFRVTRLLSILKEERFGQVFLTDTQMERVASIAERLNCPARFFEIEFATVNVMK